jgi:hypothetical protein
MRWERNFRAVAALGRGNPLIAVAGTVTLAVTRGSHNMTNMPSVRAAGVDADQLLAPPTGVAFENF